MEQNNSATPQRARKRRQGQHPSEQEKQQAQEKFLDAFARSGNILAACRQANIDRTTIYRWAEADDAFAFKKQQAERDFFDLAFAEFTRRAINGFERPVVSQGKLVMVDDGTNTGKQKPLMERVVSDRLLELIIKRGFPEYRERQQVEVSGKDGSTIGVTLTLEVAQQMVVESPDELTDWRKKRGLPAPTSEEHLG